MRTRKIRQELKELQYEIQRERATINAIKRQIKRSYGQEVDSFGKNPKHYSRESDANRIRQETGIDPDNDYFLETHLLPGLKESLNEKRKRVEYLKDELVSQFPLTPCALYRLLKRGSG